MSEQQMTKEEYVAAAKIDSLARQNAQQAIRIADLESQLNVAHIELSQLKEKAEEVPGESPVKEAEVEDLGNAH